MFKIFYVLLLYAYRWENMNMNMEIKFLLFSIRISSKQWFSLILHVQQYMFLEFKK